MISEIKITAAGVEYEFADDAPDDAREQLAAAGNPTNPTVVRDMLD